MGLWRCNDLTGRLGRLEDLAIDRLPYLKSARPTSALNVADCLSGLPLEVRRGRCTLLNPRDYRPSVRSIPKPRQFVENRFQHDHRGPEILESNPVRSQLSESLGAAQCALALAVSSSR